jgi:hypothetical protein
MAMEQLSLFFMQAPCCNRLCGRRTGEDALAIDTKRVGASGLPADNIWSAVRPAGGL